jgi:hypothetical protein
MQRKRLRINQFGWSFAVYPARSLHATFRSKLTPGGHDNWPDKSGRVYELDLRGIAQKSVFARFSRGSDLLNFRVAKTCCQRVMNRNMFMQLLASAGKRQPPAEWKHER